MLGTTLWEMTTMRRLFKRPDDSDTLMAVRAGLVPDPRATVPTYPEDLWAIVRRSLARDRDERYPTAEELARDLDAFVAAQAPDEDMPTLTGEILDALFPGEREKRAMWLRSVNVQRRDAPRATMPPPATLVGAHTPSMAPPKPPPLPPKPAAKKPRSVPKIRVPRS
jgi:serine/threonine protein kinase